MRKTVTLILIVIAAIGSVFFLFKYIRMDGIAFAWVLNFLLMIWVLPFLEALKSSACFFLLRSKGMGKKRKNLRTSWNKSFQEIIGLDYLGKTD